MSLPIFLPYNIVSIYGIGSETGISGIIPPIPPDTNPMLWGVVDAVSQYGISWAKAGDSVLFPNNKVICRLAYPAENANFTLVPEVELVCKEYYAP